jgi:2,3-bisphosphoglycerate-independent phosphoglycerate mutase
VHALLDGRDTPPRSARASLEAMAKVLDETGRGRIASVIGRYFAMDRDQRWERVREAYALMTGERWAHEAEDAVAALEAAYARDESDEFVQATRIHGQGGFVGDGDAVIFMNWRADRARELTQAFTQPDFDGFERGRHPKLAGFVTLTEYHRDFDLPVAFPPDQPENCLGEVIADLGMKQLRIAETEKYAHVTFFLNGGREQSFRGEERILVPSPKVATYDLQPEMHAPEVTDRLVDAILNGGFQLIVCNYANADMVGHSGDFQATVKAIECLDQCLGRLEDAVLEAGGEMLVTADHGNAEQMADASTGQRHTAHTTNPVPLLYVGRKADMADDGSLADIAPTALYLMGIAQPKEMTGHSLVKLG